MIHFQDYVKNTFDCTSKDGFLVSKIWKSKRESIGYIETIHFFSYDLTFLHNVIVGRLFSYEFLREQQVSKMQTKT